MKLLWVLVFVIYVVVLALLGVDGRYGPYKRGVEDPKFVELLKRARRDTSHESPLVANEPLPKQFRLRRQAPPDMPAPPDGMPAPPQFLI